MMTTRTIAARPGPWLVLACVAGPACFSDAGQHTGTGPAPTTSGAASTSTSAAPTSTAATSGEVTGSTGLTTAASAPAGCGDGNIDPGEACDDADLDDTDACLSNCQAASCGDGLVWAGVEDCDDGPANSATEPGACRLTCKDPACDDGGLYVGPLGPEIVIETGFNDIVQSNDAPRGIGVDAGGVFSVIWRVNALDDRLDIQKISPAGQPLGPFTNLLHPPVNDAKDPVIAVAPGGDFAFAWETNANANDIYLRGVVGGVGAPGFPATVDLGDVQESAAIALDDSGRTVLAFISQIGGADQVRMRLIADFNPGSPPETTISQHAVGNASPPTIALHPSGAFVIAWGDPGGQIVYRRFAAGGQPGPVVSTALRTGGFAESNSRPWSGAAFRPNDEAIVIAGLGADGRVALQRFDAADVPQELVPVAEAPRHFAPYVDVASDAWGNLAVAWVECGDPDDAALNCTAVASDLRLRWVRADMTPHAPPTAALSQASGAPPPFGIAVAPSGITGVAYVRDQAVIVRIAPLACPP